MRINKPMRILGIDQSITSTGIVVLEDQAMIHHEIISSNPELDDVYRCEEITNQVINIINSYNIELVACEGLAFGASGDATRKLAGLQFILISSIRNKTNIDDVSIIPPTTVKKHAGKGNGKKELLFDALPKSIRSVFEGYKKTKGRYDVTDAYWIASYLYTQNNQ